MRKILSVLFLALVLAFASGGFALAQGVGAGIVGAPPPPGAAGRAFINLPMKYSAEDVNIAGRAAGDARIIQSGYYIASGSNKLYAGTVFPIGFGQAPVSSGTCFFQSGNTQIGVPFAIANSAFLGETITFVSVNSGADWSSTIVSFANVGYQAVNVADTPAFSSNAACTIIIGTPKFTAADVGKGIGVQYAGAAREALNTWLNTTVTGQLLLGSGAVNPIGVQLGANSSLTINNGGQIVVGTDDSAVVNQAIANVIADTSLIRKILLVSNPHYTPTLNPNVADVVSVGDGAFLGTPISAFHQVIPITAPPSALQIPPGRVNPGANSVQFKAALAAQTASYNYPKVIIDNGGTGYTPGTYSLGVSGGPTAWAGTYTVGSNGRVNFATVTNSGTGSTGIPTLSFPSGGGSAAAGHAVQGAISVMIGDSIATTIPDGGTPAQHLMDIIREKENTDSFSAALLANYASGTTSSVSFFDRAIGGTRFTDWMGYPFPFGVTITTGGSSYTNGGPYVGGVSGGPTGFAFSYYVQNNSVCCAYVTNPGTGGGTPTFSFPTGGASQPAAGSGAAATTISFTVPSWDDTSTDALLNYIQRLSPDRVYIHLGYNDGSGLAWPQLLSVVNQLQAFTPKPDIIFLLTYPSSIAAQTTAQLAYSGDQGRVQATQTLKYFAQANGYGFLDFSTAATLVRDGQALEVNSLVRDSAVSTGQAVGGVNGNLSINWLSPYTWPTLTQDFSVFVVIQGGNWSLCGNEVQIALSSTFAGGNVIHVGNDVGTGHFYYQFDTSTVANGGAINRTIIPKTILPYAASATFTVALRGGHLTILDGTDPNHLLYDGQIERAGGLMQPVFTSSTACRYTGFGGGIYPLTFSGLPGKGQFYTNYYMPAATDYEMHGVPSTTTVSATLGAPGTVVSVANATLFAAPNPNPVIQTAVTGGSCYTIQINANLYCLNGATVVTPATGAGTINLTTNVTIADATNGNTVSLDHPPWGGDGTHPSSVMGQMVYQPVVDRTNLGQ